MIEVDIDGQERAAISRYGVKAEVSDQGTAQTDLDALMCVARKQLGLIEFVVSIEIGKDSGGLEICER
jgi:hypothetical protein